MALLGVDVGRPSIEVSECMCNVHVSRLCHRSKKKGDMEQESEVPPVVYFRARKKQKCDSPERLRLNF